MSDKLTQVSDQSCQQDQTTRQDRRAFIRKSTLAVPLIASVSSRPVWACSVSGHMSGNVSQHSADACMAPAECKPWGYWKKWMEVYQFINADRLSMTETEFNAYLANNSDDIFKISSTNKPINALYNWYLSDEATGGACAPTNNDNPAATVVTSFGEPANGKQKRYVAGILNAAHSGIEFPYPTNQWTWQYIDDKYGSTSDREAASLDYLLKEFYAKPRSNPTGLGVITELPEVTSEWDAFKWARKYLFNIS